MYSKNDNNSQKKDLKTNGWSKSAYDDSLYLNGNKKARQSDSNGHWVIDNVKYTNLSDAKKSGRI